MINVESLSFGGMVYIPNSQLTEKQKSDENHLSLFNTDTYTTNINFISTIEHSSLFRVRNCPDNHLEI